MVSHRIVVAALVCFGMLTGVAHGHHHAPSNVHPQATPATSLTEDQKIEALIRAVSNLVGATFIRNGQEYDGAAAAAHMRTKWSMAREKIKTARDFIIYAASESSVSGKPYMIRFHDGREIASAEHLTELLHEIEVAPAASTGARAATGPATRPASMPGAGLHSAPQTQPAASKPSASQPGVDSNPPAEGFDLAGSDPKAIELADLTMLAMGGRRAWDETRYLTWQFFGRRLNVWDKHTGDIRIEVGEHGGELHTLILMNLHTRKGRARKGGHEVVDPANLESVMTYGLTAWMNDAYALFMPYKLKDSGVTLKYLGERKMDDGRDADVIQLTFKDAGYEPDNKYEVFIARDTRLVGQWAFYENADQPMPKLTAPWTNWKKHGRIMLSDQRGPGRTHTDIAVFDEMPEAVFKDSAPIDWPALRMTALPVTEE